MSLRLYARICFIKLRQGDPSNVINFMGDLEFCKTSTSHRPRENNTLYNPFSLPTNWVNLSLFVFGLDKSNIRQFYSIANRTTKVSLRHNVMTLFKRRYRNC